MADPVRTLEQVLADAKGEVPLLRKRGAHLVADAIEELADAVTVSAEDYLTWLSEMKAELRSGKSARWLRSQFPAWEREGHARWHNGERQYRRLIVPQRANPIAAYEAGRRAGEDAA